MSERKYNFIFSKLMDDPDDLLGLLAYGLYKQQKIEYIEQFKKEHNNIGPSDEELAPFHDISSSPKQIEQYKQVAEVRFNEVITQLMEKNLEKFRDAAAEGERIALAEIKPTLKGYALAGIVGNISFLITIGMFFGVIKAFNSNFSEQIINWIKNLFGV